MEFIIPNDYFVSKRSPPLKELEGLYQILKQEEFKNVNSVLEFGCGITSYLLNITLKPKNFIAFEQFKPCIDSTKKYVKNINVLETDWNDIPKQVYDVIFVDSTTGFPKGRKRLEAKDKHQPFRDDSIDYSLEQGFANDKTLFILHDWSHRSEPFRLHRKYLEDRNYKLVFSIPGRFGFGGYTKI